MFGPSQEECNESRIVHRVFWWTAKGIEYESGPTHAEMLIAEPGLQHGRGVSTLMGEGGPFFQGGLASHSCSSCVQVSFSDCSVLLF